MNYTKIKELLKEYGITDFIYMSDIDKISNHIRNGDNLDSAISKTLPNATIECKKSYSQDISTISDKIISLLQGE